MTASLSKHSTFFCLLPMLLPDAVFQAFEHEHHDHQLSSGAFSDLVSPYVATSPLNQHLLVVSSWCAL